MYSNPYQRSVVDSSVSERVAFLRTVGLLTLGGLVVSGTTATLMSAVLLMVPALLNQVVALIVILGGIYGGRALGGSLVASSERSTQILGFVAGTALQGVAMGYLLLTAVLLSMELYSNPLVFLAQAGGLVALTVLGMVAWLMTGPKNLSMVGGALATLSLPMLGLMAVSFLFPVGGVFGILISLVFVGVSAGGLLYNLNQVVHQMSPRDTIPAAFSVTLGVLTLFWNVLTLLMRLQRR